MDNRWLKSRRRLLQRIKQQVYLWLGHDSDRQSTYAQEYAREFRAKWHDSTKDELMAALQASDIVYLSDFHALSESQRLHYRLLRQLDAPARKIVIGVECVESRHQKYIDQFLCGKLSEDRFLQKIKWDAHWCFPWENYRLIFNHARAHKIKIYGLNRYLKNHTVTALRTRDKHAAEKIAQIKSIEPAALLLVVFGDLHLARRHLPAMVERMIVKRGGSPPQRTIVYQDAEEIYFKLAAQELEGKIEVVRLGRSKDRYCVLNAPPWLRWQSYLMYLEQTYDCSLDLEECDYTEHVLRYAAWLAEDLGINIDADDLEIYGAHDQSWWNYVHNNLNEREQKLALHHATGDRCFWLPLQSVGYLSRMSINYAASLAGLYLHAKLSGYRTFCWQMPGDFVRLIWIECVGYLMSKLVNHKRRADTLYDLRASLKSEKDEGREALLLALDHKVTELFMMNNMRRKKRFRPSRKWSYWQAARFLGGMLGERLYNGYRGRQLSRAALLSWFKKNVDDADFVTFYIDILRQAENYPPHFRSKKETV